MDTRGQQLLLDLWLSSSLREEEVKKVIDFGRSNFHVVAESAHSFDPHGLTQVLILAESHFSVHTYPEHRYMSIDLYICDLSIDLVDVRDRILKLVPTKTYRSQIIERGINPDLIASSASIVPHLENSQAQRISHDD